MKIFYKMVITKQVWGTIHFHSIILSTMEANGAANLLGYKIFTHIFLTLSHRNHNKLLL